MPKAEVGSTKYLNNKLKSKGLQRLRWYCQVCERQMRDENGFKMHTQSETHVRQMLLVGEDPRKYIDDFSNQFRRDFLQLLRTAHGEKPVSLNRFYQEYIANKEHVHMNATRWPSLTEFAKFLGREGICRVVDEDEQGLQVAWIDNSPENLRRQEAIRKKERQDKGDEEREQMLIRQQVRKARAELEARGEAATLEEDEVDESHRQLRREEGNKIRLNLARKPGEGTDESTEQASESQAETAPTPLVTKASPDHATPPAPKVALKLGGVEKPKNVFAAARKNVLGGKKGMTIEQPKKMSEAEQIMKEEMARNKHRTSPYGDAASSSKRQRI